MSTIAQPPVGRSTEKSPFSWSALAVAALVALLIAVGNTLFWFYSNRPVVMGGFDGQVNGFAFNGYQRDEDPVQESYPSEHELASDLQLLSHYTNRIRLYSSTEMDAVPALARELGMRVTAGAWLNRQKDHNALEIKALLESLHENTDIERAIVGNESVLRGDLTVPELIRYLDIVRRRTKVPISTAEPWHIWLKHPELADHVDFITVHLLPYWEGVPRQAAVDHVLRRYEQLRRAFPRKKIVIGEVGWPSNGDRHKSDTPLPDYSTASVTDEAEFIRQFLVVAREKKLDYYLMEAFDQPWKREGEGRVGPYWGMFDAERQPKFSLQGDIVSDPTWPKKAIVASFFAFLPILWFAYAFRRFGIAGITFFGVLIQASSTLVVWLLTLPFEFYLNDLDWTMLIILLPALAAMLMILLANGFEFTEAVWCKRWLRPFTPLPLAPDDPEPFVSIHLPCHNEPPEMVIQTLASLARLDYRNFEVLVIDNNTKLEDTWKPIERYVENMETGEGSPRVRFFHLDNWPGFKAGALNFALEQTDPRAEVIGVVDADYVVRQDWLRAQVKHFEQAQVAVVQAPQAHRDWQHNPFQRMCSWEYDGFFRIGMHHRNERDAIIQHGTMTLVRKTALASTGGWSEWCICEDAELGLRLMNAGWETRYIDEIFGRGLTPSNFAGYKSQRFRWAFGAMQILKRRWSWLWGNAGGQVGLTGGQRFHFLTGWFSWFADALHLLFTLGAVGWTVGMIANPENFSLPLDLFIVPVIGFFCLKAFFGPMLYRVRVPCGWLDVIGASVASMALSHAIARGIIAGLAQKKGTFVVTPKSWQLSGKSRWLPAVREEVMLLAGICTGIAGTLYSMPMQYETLLWVAILATQSIPYLSAFTCALISARGGRFAPPQRASADGEQAPALVLAGGAPKEAGTHIPLEEQRPAHA